MLAAWSASPARLREDANAEEALALGGYADRAVLELVANGVDAAKAGGVPARILVRWLTGPAGAELRVANTGAPVTAAGVAGLASLRASAKRGEAESVGHFGVGFTAVLGFTDEPSVVSRTGTVLFSLARSAAAAADLGPAQEAELRARAGRVPVLRLAFAGQTPPVGDPLPADFATEVRLPVRSEARAAAEGILADLGPDLFWAVPGLDELAVEHHGQVTSWQRRVLAPDQVEIADGRAAVRYRTVHRAGTVPAALLADRPTEERDRRGWWLTWFRPEADRSDDFWPLDADDALEAVSRLGAPTPTDEPLTLPARLTGTFPVDETRRHLSIGPLSDLLLREAASAYVELFAAAPPAQRWRLIPGRRFPAGEVDGLLRAEILSALAESAELTGVLGDPIPVADAVLLPALPAAALRLVAEAMPTLIPSAGSTAEADALRRLGVRVAAPAEASSALAALARPPEFFRALYELLREQDPEDWSDVPVPLASGRTVVGARGTLLPGEIDAGLLARLVRAVPSLPLVDPAAASGFLLRLGAERADAGVLLAADAVRNRFAEFRALLDEVDPDPDDVDQLGALALDLIEAGASSAPDLVLTDADGEPWPAAELLLPDAPLAALLDAEADLPTLASRWTRVYPAEVLRRAGVRNGLTVSRFPVSNGELGEQALDTLPDVERWWDQAPESIRAGEFVAAVPDLDLIDPDRWPEALAMLAADPDTRAVILAEPDGYPAWWVARYATVSGIPVGQWRLPDARDLAGLFDVLPGPLDPVFARALGVLPDLNAAARRCPDELLARYSHPARMVPAALVGRVTAAVLAVVAAGAQLPAGVRSLDGTVVDPDDAVVLDHPWWAQVLPAGRLVPGGSEPERTADLLDLETATERYGDEAVTDASTRAPVDSSLVAAVCAALGVPAGTRPADVAAGPRGLVVPAGTLSDPPAGAKPEIFAAAQVTVTLDGARIPVVWWPDGQGAFVTDGSPTGVGRAVAWAVGAWADRFVAVSAAGGSALEFTESGVDGPHA